MARLCRDYPPLGPHILYPTDTPNKEGQGTKLQDRRPKSNRQTINFADSAAVRALNTALLVSDYGLSSPTSADAMPPPDALVPPVPGRADYVHHIADVLALSASGKGGGGGRGEEESDGNGDSWDDIGIPTGPAVRGFDVGTGASCIYPLLAASCYGWSMIATEVNAPSVESARQLVETNGYDKLIDVRHQRSREMIFNGVWKTDEKEEVDFVMCNPPFYFSREAYLAENRRKIRGLSRGGARRYQTSRDKGAAAAAAANNDTGKIPSVAGSNNFGGSDSELWCPGGEVAFVTRIVEESARHADRCLWFTSLVSRRNNVSKIKRLLRRKMAKKSGEKIELACKAAPGEVEVVRTLPMGAGSKRSTIILWSYLTPQEQREWARRRGWGK